MVGGDGDPDPGEAGGDGDQHVGGSIETERMKHVRQVQGKSTARSLLGIQEALGNTRTHAEGCVKNKMISKDVSSSSGFLHMQTDSCSNYEAEHLDWGQQSGQIEWPVMSEADFENIGYMNVEQMSNSKQGYFTGLLMEQIRNSQDEIENESNTQRTIGTYMDALAGKCGLQDIQVPGILQQNDHGGGWGVCQSEMHMISNTSEDGVMPSRDMEITSFEATGGEEAEIDADTGSWAGDELYQNKIFNTLQLEEITDQTEHCTEMGSMSAILNEGEIDVQEEVDGSQELTEQEIEDYIKSEQQAASEGNNADVDSKYTPQMGMEFKDRDDAHHFFSFYGFLAGFKVVVSHVTRTTSKKKNNEIYKQEMRCHRYGKMAKNTE